MGSILDEFETEEGGIMEIGEKINKRSPPARVRMVLIIFKKK